MASSILFRNVVSYMYCNARQLHASSILLSKYRDRIPYEKAWLNEPGQPLREIVVEEFSKSLTMDQKLQVAATEPRVIVKVIDRQLMREKKKAQKDAKLDGSKKKNEHKEFQFSWSTAPGDLEHKLKAVRKELERGARVDIVFSPKKRTQPPPLHHMKEKLHEMEQLFADISHPYKEQEIVPYRGIAATFLRGT